MALHFLRLRRALYLTSSILHRQPQPTHPVLALSHILPNAAASSSTSSTGALTRRPFTSTTSLFLSQRGKVYDPDTDDQIGPDTILFEGCDYNHWLITMEFPKDAELTRDQKIEEYVNTAAQVFGSVEEAKKKIYALSTTTYQGFQVLCSEETSEKFKMLRGVVFVLPDSYIDPINKEYGGDKYENGEIFPRPPPVHYGRRNNNMDRRPRDQMSYQQRQPNYGPPRQPNYGPPPPHQNNGPPQQNHGLPQPQQNNGPPPLQNYGQPQPQQNNGPPQQNHGPLPSPQQNYVPSPPRQNYGPQPPLPQNYGPPAPPPTENYGQPPPPPPRQNYGLPPQPNHGTPPQQNGPPPPRQNYWSQLNYGPPQQQQNYEQPAQQSYGQPPNFPPPQNYGPPGSGERRGPTPQQNNAPGGRGANPMPSYSGNFNQGEAGNYNAQGQRDYQQGNLQYQQTGFPRDANYGSSESGNFEQVSRDQRNTGNN